MTRFIFLIIIFPLLLFSCRVQQQPGRPNIVLIMADDLGYECLGCDGGTSYATPNLDRLADAGLRFRYCFSQPLCTPSRVQLMTGKYNYRNYTAFGILKKGEKTFANIFQEAGYKTGIAGKWQLYGSTDQKALKGTGTLPHEAGFDEFCLWQIDLRGSRYADPIIYYNSLTPDTLTGKYGPDIFMAFIEDFLTRHRQKPFFLYYPMVLPHAPHMPTPDSPEWKTNRYKRDNRFFADMVAYVDKNVGLIIQKLDELGLRSNTLVIFTGDNGTNRAIVSMMGDKAVHGGKGLTLLTGTHVPLIMNWPGHIAGGQVSEKYVDFTDFLPTLLDVADVHKPDDFFTDGHSIARLIEGKHMSGRKWVYCYYDPKWAKFKYARFVYTPFYKLYDDGRFINLTTDEMEKHPLPADSLSNREKRIKKRFMKVLNVLK